MKPTNTYAQPHPSLGYSHVPGQWTIHYKTGLSIQLTNLDSTLRVTRPLDTYPAAADKETIWIFGGSYTQGEALNDHETYPWLLQRRLPELEIVNFGASGYGTLHSLVQYKEALQKRKRPLAAVLAYAGFHRHRNLPLRIRRKSLVLNLENLGLQPPLPGVTIGPKGELEHHVRRYGYRPIPLQRSSALAHLAESAFVKLEARLSEADDLALRLLGEFQTLSAERGIHFVLAGISQSPETRSMLRYWEQKGARTIDISVDLDAPGNRNLPWDNHPSPAANRHYAHALGDYLEQTVLDRKEDSRDTHTVSSSLPTPLTATSK